MNKDEASFAATVFKTTADLLQSTKGRELFLSWPRLENMNQALKE